MSEVINEKETNSRHRKHLSAYLGRHGFAKTAREGDIYAPPLKETWVRHTRFFDEVLVMTGFTHADRETVRALIENRTDLPDAKPIVDPTSLKRVTADGKISIDFCVPESAAA